MSALPATDAVGSGAGSSGASKPHSLMIGGGGGGSGGSGGVRQTKSGRVPKQPRHKDGSPLLVSAVVGSAPPPLPSAGAGAAKSAKRKAGDHAIDSSLAGKKPASATVTTIGDSASHSKRQTKPSAKYVLALASIAHANDGGGSGSSSRHPKPKARGTATAATAAPPHSHSNDRTARGGGTAAAAAKATAAATAAVPAGQAGLRTADWECAARDVCTIPGVESYLTEQLYRSHNSANARASANATSHPFGVDLSSLNRFWSGIASPAAATAAAAATTSSAAPPVPPPAPPAATPQTV